MVCGFRIPALKYVCCWSGGKDSTCSVILAHEHQEPIDYIVFSEVMFDRKAGISGENIKHIQFVKEVAKPLFESWGYEVRILKAEKDYLDCFYRRIEKPRKHMYHKGMKFGFPTSGRCGVKRDCKMRPINEFLCSLHEPVLQYVGIATDEPVRLESLHKDPSKVSLLEKYGYSEAMARKKCMEYGLYSPGYELSKRGGCWFCPYAKEAEHLSVYECCPEAWQQFVLLESEEDLANNRWNVYGPTLKERDDKIRRLSMYKQVNLLDQM